MSDRIVRSVACLAVAAAAAILLFELSIEPYRCNVAEKRLQRELEAVLDRPLPLAQREARRILAEVLPLREKCPTATNLHMVAGLCYRTLGDFDAAVAAYEEALRWDRRSEVYFNLGMTLLSAGRKEEAIEVLIRAAAFDPYMIWRIGDPDVADRVYQAVHRRNDPLI